MRPANPVFFHWAPSGRRVDILQHGLVVYSEPSVQSGDARWPYICLSPHPSLAWGLSGDFAKERDDETDEWDLWQVWIPRGAEIHVREFWWPDLEEVKCYTSIPADCVWFVGQRTDKMIAVNEDGTPYMEPEPKPKKKRKKK